MKGSRRARTLCWGALGLAAAWFGLEAQATSYDFSYRLSGDRRVAPIQVFDDGRQTWLQFAPGQVMPAVFVQHPNQAMQLAAYQQQGPYLVLQGTAGQIDLRIGDILARAEYTGTVTRQPAAAAAPPAPALASLSAPSSNPQATPIPAAHFAPPTAHTAPSLAPPPVVEPAHSSPGRPAQLVEAAIAPGRLASATASPGSAERAVRRSAPASSEFTRVSHDMPSGATGSGAFASAVSNVGAPAAAPLFSGEAALEFDAALSDRNMRRVLERWARQVGWTFQPEHWTVDVDIPLVGAASFGPDFRNAVRGLLAATELGERPLQPCFYSNRVLRVIAFSQACDRTAAPVVLADRG